jgi:hypothetical protein
VWNGGGGVLDRRSQPMCRKVWVLFMELHEQSIGRKQVDRFVLALDIRKGHG